VTWTLVVAAYRQRLHFKIAWHLDVGYEPVAHVCNAAGELDASGLQLRHSLLERIAQSIHAA
jgi:hypothetical protein